MSDLKPATLALRNAVQALIGERDNLDKSNVLAIAEYYGKIYDFEKIICELYEIIKGVKDNFSNEILPDTLESMEVDSIKIKGRMFSIGTRFNASISIKNREAAHAWLRENGLGALIVPNVNSKSLSSAIKEHIETTAIEPPEDCISIHRQKYTSVRKG